MMGFTCVDFLVFHQAVSMFGAMGFYSIAPFSIRPRRLGEGYGCDMPHFEIVSLIFITLLVWFWLDSLKAREAGFNAVRRACNEEGLQLLDETIAFLSLGIARNEQGRLVWRRVYQFEYSDTGDNRRRGSVHLLGHRVALLNVGLRLVASNDRSNRQFLD